MTTNLIDRILDRVLGCGCPHDNDDHGARGCKETGCDCTVPIGRSSGESRAVRRMRARRED